MRYYLLLLLVLLISCNNCPSEVPHIITPKGTRSKRNVVVFTSGDNKMYIGTKEAPVTVFDSLLAIEIRKAQDNILDTVTVVISADSNTHYKVVFDIMKSAKRLGARVVANLR